MLGNLVRQKEGDHMFKEVRSTPPLQKGPMLLLILWFTGDGSAPSNQGFQACVNFTHPFLLPQHHYRKEFIDI